MVIDTESQPVAVACQGIKLDMDMVVEIEPQGVVPASAIVNLDTEMDDYEWKIHGEDTDSCDEDGDISMSTEESSWMSDAMEEDDVSSCSSTDNDIFFHDPMVLNYMPRDILPDNQDSCHDLMEIDMPAVFWKHPGDNDEGDDEDEIS